MDNGIAVLEAFVRSLPTLIVIGDATWTLAESVAVDHRVSFSYEALGGQRVCFESRESDLDRELADGEDPDLLLACMEAEMIERISTMPSGGYAKVQRI